MRLFGASFIIFLFVSFSLFYKAAYPRWIKVSGSFAILLISLKYAWYQLIGGSFFSPALPRAFIIVMEALYGGLILLFFLLVLWDIYLLFNWLLKKAGMPVPRHLPRGKIQGVLVLIALCLGCFGTWETIRVPDIKNINLTLKNLPCNLSGLKIVQLSDLHIGPILKKDWVAAVVEKVNAIDPDFILLTGDYIDGYVANIGQELEPLADLRAKFGIFAVTGNHEYYWNVTEWEDALKKFGISWLNNSHAAVDIGGEKVIIAGIPDYGAKRFGFPAPNIRQPFRDAPDGVRILLSHQPRNAEKNLEQADLQLSGHTHGGIMFFLAPLIAHYNNGFVRGLYELGDDRLYVSPGTGLWNGFSSRVGVPAEITVFKLQCPQAEEEEESAEER